MAARRGGTNTGGRCRRNGCSTFNLPLLTKKRGAYVSDPRQLLFTATNCGTARRHRYLARAGADRVRLGQYLRPAARWQAYAESVCRRWALPPSKIKATDSDRLLIKTLTGTGKLG